MLTMITVGKAYANPSGSSLCFSFYPPPPTHVCRNPPIGLFLLFKLHFALLSFLTFKIIIGGRMDTVVWCRGQRRALLD